LGKRARRELPVASFAGLPHPGDTSAVGDFDVDAFEAYEARGWGEKEVSSYDDLAGRVTSQVADPLLDAVEAVAGTRLLDVATGPGYVAARAGQRGAHPVGLDLSETMLAFARDRHRDVEFLRGDACDLPFADGSFDAVVAAFLLLHLGRPERAVVEALRVVVPGGRVAFTVWDVPSRGRWLGVLLDALADVGADPPAEIPAGPPIFRFADESEFAALLRAGGFSEVSVDTLELSLRLESADELWHGLMAGTVRVGPLVAAQSQVVQDQVYERFVQLLGDYRVDDGFDVPVAVKLATGRRER
jgi:SAM-dependent methyltransferase